MNNTTQTPDKLLVIDSYLLNEAYKNVSIIVANYEDNKLLKDREYYKYKGMQSAYKSIIKHSYPLTPMLEDAWGQGASSMHNITYISCGIVPHISYNNSSLVGAKQTFLSQPIKLEK